MNYETSSSLINAKIEELKSQIAYTKTNDAISKNTRGTKLYALSRERRILVLMDELMSHIHHEFVLSEETRKTFNLLTTLADEREVYKPIEVHVGDSILDLARKYDGRKDILNKIVASAEKAGLVANMTTGMIEAQ